jgi:flagellar basal-body rod protein FlgF
MSNTIYAALSKQAALSQELSSIANNVANASTAGYRGDGLIFSEYVHAIAGEPSLSQSRIGARVIDASQGEFMQTGGALDVAIEGEGYFVVTTPQGERLTRSGSFQTNEAGLLVTDEGYVVQSAGGGALTISGNRRVVISGSGVVTSGEAAIGQLRVVDADPASLTREGATLFRADGQLTDKEPTVRSGFIEQSNVEPVLELSRLIEVQRAFEFGQQLLTGESERIERAVNVIGGNR